MSTVRFRYMLWGVTALVLFAGVLVAKFLGQAGVVNRVGTLITGLAAGAGYLQIRHDLGAEQKRRLKTTTAQSEGTMSTPLETLRQRLDEKANDHFMAGLDQDRTHVAATVVAIAAVGELIQGFGDILLTSITK